MSLPEDWINNLIAQISSPSFEMVQIGVLIYIGLLWLSVIIWITRDSIQRSKSLAFQTFAILINIAIPVLGVLLYLIIRPGQTLMEKYVQEMEQRLLQEAMEDKKPRNKKGLNGKD